MNRGDVERLLTAASRATPYREFVIIGSLSVLGAVPSPPAAMVGSIDVDLYPKEDPSGAGDVARAVGLGSEFEQRHGYYADAVSPWLPTLPDDWQQRLLPLGFSGGVTAWFLEPNDAAISKYARAEPRDLRWIGAGLQAGILSIATIEYRMRETVMEPGERARAKAAIQRHRRMLAREAKRK